MSTNDIKYFYNTASIGEASTIDIREVSNITRDKSLISAFEKILFKDTNGTVQAAINSCQRCRKLKKKCTKHKPKCLNCFKTNYECIYVEKSKSGRISTFTSGDRYVNTMAANTTIINDTISHIGSLGDLGRVVRDPKNKVVLSTELQRAYEAQLRDIRAKGGDPDVIFGSSTDYDLSPANNSPRYSPMQRRYTQNNLNSPRVGQQHSRQFFSVEKPSRNNGVPAHHTNNSFNQPSNVRQTSILNGMLASAGRLPTSVPAVPPVSQTSRIQPLSSGQNQSNTLQVQPQPLQQASSIYKYPYGEIISNAFPPSYVVFQEKTRQSLINDFPPDPPAEESNPEQLASTADATFYTESADGTSLDENPDATNDIHDAIDPELHNLLAQ